MKPKTLRIRKERNEIKISCLRNDSGGVSRWFDFHLSVGEAERFADKIDDVVSDLKAQQRRDDFDVVLDDAEDLAG